MEKILTDDLMMSDFLNSSALMRFLGNSILLDARSLHLLSLGHPMAYEETQYRSWLKTNVDLLDKSLIKIGNELQGYEFLHDVFTETEVELTHRHGDIIEIYKQNLFQAIQRIISESNVILNTELSDFEEINNSLFFLYQNFPGDTLKKLNNSVYILTNDIKSNTRSTFNFLEYFKISFFIPPIIIIILSIPSMILLEKINKQNWKNLSNLDLTRHGYLRDRLHERLFDLHGVTLEDNDQRYSKRGNYRSI